MLIEDGMIIIVGENDHADMAIRRTFDLTRYGELNINTEDTFATACFFLGMSPPQNRR